MDVSQVSGSYTASLSEAAQTDNSTLDMNDFFSLMAAELQNQTMYDTVDNAEYMGQLAQFSMLSQMQELSQQYSLTYAISLVGKDVEVKSVDENGIASQVSGTVEQVSFTGGNPYITINGSEYDPSEIVAVKSGNVSEGENDGTA